MENFRDGGGRGYPFPPTFFIRFFGKLLSVMGGGGGPPFSSKVYFKYVSGSPKCSFLGPESFYNDSKSWQSCDYSHRHWFVSSSFLLLSLYHFISTVIRSNLIQLIAYSATSRPQQSSNFEHST